MIFPVEDLGSRLLLHFHFSRSGILGQTLTRFRKEIVFEVPSMYRVYLFFHVMLKIGVIYVWGHGEH